MESERSAERVGAERERERSAERAESSAHRSLRSQPHRGVNSVPVIINSNLYLLTNQSIHTRVTLVLTSVVSVSVLVDEIRKLICL